MKKSNWIIYCIALIASAFLLWLWYWLEFDHIDAPFDLVLSIIWWILIALSCYGIHRIEKKRQERVRTCYLSKKQLFNSETGAKPMVESAVDGIEDTLKELEYGFDIQDMPDDLKVEAVVRSKVFEVKQEADEERGVEEELEWEGEVALPSRPDDDPLPFKDKEELGRILVSLPFLA